MIASVPLIESVEPDLQRTSPRRKIRCVTSGKNRCGGRCSSSRQEIESESAGAGADEVTTHVCAHGTGSPLGSWLAPTAARSCVTPRSLVSKARTQLEAESSRRRLEPQLVQVMWVNIQARSGLEGFL